MKLTAIAFTLMFCTTLFAKTTVTVPLTVEMNNKSVTVAEINKKYKLTGKDKLVENLVVTNERASLSAAHDTYWAANSAVEELAEKVDGEFYLELSSPQGCYTGIASEAFEIVGSLSDGPFSDQLGFWGWKYKQETHLDMEDSDGEVNEILNKESKLWKNWKGYDDSILIIFHVTDSGDDVNNALITKCK